MAVNVTTIDKMIESMKMQLKPHLTDDVILYEGHIIDMYNQSRSAMIAKLYIAGNNLNAFYQEIEIESEDVSSIQVGNRTITSKLPIEKIELPDIQIIGGATGHKNISYIGSVDYALTDIEYVEFEEFQNYLSHRFGNDFPCYTNLSNIILIRNARGQKTWKIRAIFLNPTAVPGYDNATSIYPIDGTLLRQIEIITFQHLASKLGMPQDVFNNATDETKNAPAMQGQKQQQSSDDDQQQ